MSDRPRAFVELCCGSAAVTLRLLGGRYAVPPISYMGSKRGYAGAILAALGLRSGIGADSVLLCDAGPWAHIYATLADPGRCAEVATILRGWADEDPRALWERLREEHRGEWDGWGAERAAGWLQIDAWTINPALGERRRAYCGPGKVAKSGIEPYAAKLTPPKLATRVESVAAWLQVGALSMRGDVDAGFEDALARYERGGRGHPTNGAKRTAGRVDGIAAPLSIYAGPAEDLDPPDDCEGVYMLIDPPYHGANGEEKITGYAHDLPRADLLTLLHRWSDAGAVVCCCECVGLAGELGVGWWEVDITGARVGQRRTFSKQSAEWLTMNREPVEVPAVQREMFG